MTDKHFISRKWPSVGKMENIMPSAPTIVGQWFSICLGEKEGVERGQKTMNKDPFIHQNLVSFLWASSPLGLGLDCLSLVLAKKNPLVPIFLRFPHSTLDNQLILLNSLLGYQDNFCKYFSIHFLIFSSGCHSSLFPVVFRMGMSFFPLVQKS